MRNIRKRVLGGLTAVVLGVGAFAGCAAATASEGGTTTTTTTVARRAKPAKLAANTRLREYVEDRLAGAVTDADGRPIPGPNVPWKGRRHGRRADRRWGTAWTPEQMSHRLRLDSRR